MARRRGRRAPYAKWVRAFAYFNTITAKGYDEWAGTVPETLPFAFGAVFRITLAKVALPRIHLYLVKGMEPREAVVKAIEDAVNTIKQHPEIVNYVLERLGIEGNPEDYIKYIEQAANFILEHLNELEAMAGELYGMAPAQAQAQAAA